eukprot:SAG11_NODE_28886_length_316_cov_2.972350_1_plen_53_part_10
MTFWHPAGPEVSIIIKTYQHLLVHSENRFYTGRCASIHACMHDMQADIVIYTN